MIRIISTSRSSPLLVKIDPYVHISIEQNEIGQNPLYWRVKHGDHSLLEVGVHPKKGTIESLTLVSIDRNHVNSVLPSFELEANKVLKAEGLPVVDLSPWHSNQMEYQQHPYLDEEGSLMLRVGADAALIELNAPVFPSQWVYSGSVFFGLNEKKMLSLVYITGLHKDQVAILTAL